MLFISGENNILVPGTAELHIQENEDLTILFPDGGEVYVTGNGQVFDSQSKEMR